MVAGMEDSTRLDIGSRSLACVPVTRDNLEALTSLQLKPGQDRFVSPVVQSVAEAYVNPTAWPRAIVNGTEVVGFVMANFDRDNEVSAFRCGIWRLNIAAHAQGRGVGRFAVEHVAAQARARGFDAISVLWLPGAGGPEPFYLACGFEPTGEVLFGQVVGVRSAAFRVPAAAG